MEEEVLLLLLLVRGGALEEDLLLLLLLLLLGEGLLQQLVVGALKEDCFQLDWEVLQLHGEQLLLSTGALLPVMMFFCLFNSTAALYTILTLCLSGILLYIPCTSCSTPPPFTS